ncbi:MAG: carbamoyl-phosphate synthase large subunit [Clostridia bacterium]|nr:carbamoyl-phosphate synthase large subunit [Clostridia bacterium]
MPRRQDLKKVMVLGSGPIVIGQAAEFDYAGTQACKSLREEGLEVVLLNSNPATIMTDDRLADRVYLEPLDLETAARVIEKERPEGLLPTLGGQTGLNLAVALAEAGILAAYNVELLGTPLATIRRAEDRQLFKETMAAIGEPVPPSGIAHGVEEALTLAQDLGYPVVVRPAYTLGGTGGGLARDAAELAAVARRGLAASPVGQILLEKSVAGWKEIEYEVMRDAADNCLTVCNMENLDPMGIHTGDSIVVAPSQTLSDREYQMLRSAALKIVRALGVEGGCNIQFALDPQRSRYYVIEVNPRVSRSSALASKATGYPIAKVAAKIAVGLRLDEIVNPVTGKTTACFEPALDYMVVKIPRWPFDKFVTADRTLGTQMKATGEVMAIERTFEAALMKGVRSLEIGVHGLRYPDAPQWSEMEVEDRLTRATDERLFAIAEAFRRRWTVREVHLATGIDPFFLRKIKGLVRWEEKLAAAPLTPGLLRQAKRLGFSDVQLAKIRNTTPEAIRRQRLAWGIRPVFKMVDTCAAEFAAATPYYYSTYEEEDEAPATMRPKVVVLGAGPIRIGQGIEFDYCSVHALWGLREAGFEAIIINNNPETVSTDFDTADRLYFEPLTLEDVLNVIDREKPLGVVVQFGGQTAINLAPGLAAAGVPLLGTAMEGIDAAEDRRKCAALLRQLGISQSEGDAATTVAEALAVAAGLGYPVLVRPSYVIGGRAMEVVSTPKELEQYMAGAVRVSPQYPVLIDKYLRGREVEVDAVSDGESVFLPAIFEHVERAGVHSGDSIAFLPPQTLTAEEIAQIVDATQRIGRGLGVVGLLNVQYAVSQGRAFVLEVNPRASRTVPIVSKVTGVPLVKLATLVVLGKSLRELGYPSGLAPAPPQVAVKAPVFSFGKLPLAELALGPEMKSTGEVLGLDYRAAAALAKAFAAAGLGARRPLARQDAVLLAVADRDKEQALPLARSFRDLGFTLWATPGTAAFLARRGIETLVWPWEELNGELPRGVVLVVNTPTRGRMPSRRGFALRQLARERGVGLLTSLDTACALAWTLAHDRPERRACLPLDVYLGAARSSVGERAVAGAVPGPGRSCG